MFHLVLLDMQCSKPPPVNQFDLGTKMTEMNENFIPHRSYFYQILMNSWDDRCKCAERRLLFGNICFESVTLRKKLTSTSGTLAGQ